MDEIGLNVLSHLPAVPDPPIRRRAEHGAEGGRPAPQPGRRGGHRWGQVPCTTLCWELYSTELLSLGCQTLYHLAKMGVTNTVLLEKDQLTAGRYSNVLS